jgi:hypothetical protein
VPVAETAALEAGGRTQAVPAAELRRDAPPPYGSAPSPYDTTYETTDRPRRGLLTAALVVAVLLIAGLVALAVATDDPPDPKAGSPASHSPATGATTSTPSPSESSSSPSDSSPSDSSPPASSPTADSNVPAGYQLYQDPSGFSVAVPDGWQAEQSGATTVDVKDPSGSRFLRFDQTDKPKGDPKKDWERQEKSVSKRLPNYERVSIESVDYRGWPAADWEFTFGNGTHVLDRGFKTDGHQGYAIYLSSPEDEWGASQDIFQTAADTFQPAGG